MFTQAHEVANTFMLIVNDELMDVAKRRIIELVD
jgi:hypothetical protein